MKRRILRISAFPVRVALASVVVLCGTALVGAAVNTYTSTEAESGTKTTQVASITDVSASGGNAVKFTALTADAPAGVFITQSELARAKTRGASTAQPFRNSYNAQTSRANAALSTTPSPF